MCFGPFSNTQETQYSVRMFCVSGLVVFMLVLTVEAKVGYSSESSLCAETDQHLLFERPCENQTCGPHCAYEVRHYKSVTKVSTTETSTFELAAIWGFTRLYKYITGDNKGGHSLKMVTPVLMKIPDNIFIINTYEVIFFLPTEYEMNPPKPTDPRVTISTEDITVYVKKHSEQFGKLSDIIQANCLTNKLHSVGAKFKSQYHYTAVYRSPMSTPQYNEVWYEVDDCEGEGDPVCFSDDSSEESSEEYSEWTH